MKQDFVRLDIDAVLNSPLLGPSDKRSTMILIVSQVLHDERILCRCLSLASLLSTRRAADVSGQSPAAYFGRQPRLGKLHRPYAGGRARPGLPTAFSIGVAGEGRSDSERQRPNGRCRRGP